MLGNYIVASQLVASRVVLGSIELVNGVEGTDKYEIVVSGSFKSSCRWCVYVYRLFYLEIVEE
jgi:hypothetical protein